MNMNTNINKEINPPKIKENNDFQKIQNLEKKKKSN